MCQVEGSKTNENSGPQYDSAGLSRPTSVNTLMTMSMSGVDLSTCHEQETARPKSSELQKKNLFIPYEHNETKPL